MKKKEKKEIQKSQMLKELEQIKILGGRKTEASRLSMKNCKQICTGESTTEQKQIIND